MRSNLELSTKELEDFIVKKLNVRLQRILWGENCDSLKEALTFSEEWLFKDNLNPDLALEMQEYLFKEGFVPKRMILNGRRYSSWTLSANSKNDTFRSVRSEYEKSFKEALRFWETKAAEVIVDFSYSLSQVISVNVGNRIYRKYILDKLAQYNRDLIYSKNSKHTDETREYIYYALTKQESIIFLSKRDDFYWQIEQAEYDFVNALGRKIYNFLFEVNRIAYAYRYDRVPRKLVTFVSNQYMQEFKEIFEKGGIEVTLQPKYSERMYAKVGNFENDNVPVFLEIPNLVYRPLMNNESVNRIYMNFCEYYR